MKLDYKAKFKDSLKHFQTGLAYMLPVLMIGALGKAIPILFGQGNDPANPIFKAFLAAGNFGFNMFIPVLAAYISFAIADLPGLAPGLIIGLIAKDGGSGYLGGLLGGFLAGYMTYTIMGLSDKFPKTLKSTWDNVAPSLGALIVAVIIFLFVNPPVKLLMEGITNLLTGMTNAALAALGAVMGGLVGVDFGGPIGQAKFFFALGALEQKFLVPMAIAGATASCPAVGMCLATYLAPHLYKEKMRDYGRTSIVYSLIGGWTEIAIPFVVDDWLRVTIASIVGSAVAGAIAGFISLQVLSPGLGVLYLPLYDKWWGYLLAMGVGSLVVALLANFLKSSALKTAKKVAKK